MSKQTLYNFLGSYNKAYKSKIVEQAEFSDFLSCLKKFYKETSSINLTNEELLKDKFKECVLGGYQIFANENRIDLSIKKDGKTQVICEFKQPSNKSEMLQVDSDNINKKALQEAIWYFYNQETKEISYGIKNILITDTEQFFFFNPKAFCNKDLEKLCLNYRNNQVSYTNTKILYEQIGEKINSKEITFDYTEFDLLKYKDKILQDNLSDNDIKQLKYFYKALHPDFLLREFSPKDSNELNSKFYHELLYILGLEEVGKGQKLIQPSKIKGTLRDRICSDLNNCVNFDDVINLIIIWLNRLLFLKLFESQLISFNNSTDFAFLNSDKITSFSKLNKLFFNILGKPLSDREDKNIPYLNSSLFERASLEEKYGNIANLDNETTLELFKGSVLAKVKNYPKNPPLLKYFLDFLESYSFSSQINKNGSENNNKEIINSSVLGLIFEKLNGYKDGSFFTPAYITEYMAQNAIDNIVLEKFNSAFEGIKAPCETIEDLKNLLNYDRHIKDRRDYYNSIIDNLKICDPAVGSGHFLVSVLNYLIALKSELGLLEITNKIEIQNDSLIIYELDGETQFEYKRNDLRSLEIQKAIFSEKRKIIENSLFGVDINPNSVQICCLRLWIELLKNTYYIDNTDVMQILPNIDINIKCGNSLISGYRVNVGKCALDEVDGRTTQAKEIKEYKELVASYKNLDNKISKVELREKIKKIKNKLFPPIQLGLFEDRLKQGIFDNSMEWMIEFPELLDDQGRFVGFDVIIGNPPYININSLKEYKNIYRNIYNTAYGGYDIYIIFFEMGLKLLKRDAHLTYITSNKYLISDYGIKLRKLFLSDTKLIHIIDLADCKRIFNGASVSPCITKISKTSGNVDNNTSIYILKKGDEKNINSKQPYIFKQKHLGNNKNATFDIKINFNNQTLLKKILNNTQTLESIADVRTGVMGFDYWSLDKYISEIKNINLIRIATNSFIMPYKFLWGKKVNLFKKNYNNTWLDIEKCTLNKNTKELFKTLKIIIRGVAQRLTAVMDSEGIGLLVAVHSAVIKDDGYNVLYILALLNSKLINWYHLIKFYTARIPEGSLKYPISFLKTIPIKKIDNATQQMFEAIVNKIHFALHSQDYLQNQEKQNAVKEYEKEIDLMVYELYGLTDEEIRIIDEEQ